MYSLSQAGHFPSFTVRGYGHCGPTRTPGGVGLISSDVDVVYLKKRGIFLYLSHFRLHISATCEKGIYSSYVMDGTA